jgi:hypothetical protein
LARMSQRRTTTTHRFVRFISMAITMRDRERPESLRSRSVYAPVYPVVSSCDPQPQKWLNQFSALLECGVDELKWLFPREKATCLLSTMTRKSESVP